MARVLWPLLLPAAVCVQAEDWERQARALVRAGEYSEAATLCERGLRADPDREVLESLYLSLPSGVLAARWAERYEHARTSTDAAELIELGRELSDFDPHRKTEGPKLALDLLARAIAIQPANARAHFEYGRALRTNGSPDEMFAAWDRALARTGDDGLRLRIYTWIAHERAVLGEIDRANAAFRSAHQLNSRRHDPHRAWEYFLFLKEQSRRHEAAGVLREVLAWSPGFVPAVLERARVALSRNSWDAAIRDANYVLRYAEGNPEMERGAHGVLARAYHAIGRAEAKQHAAWVEAHAR